MSGLDFLSILGDGRAFAVIGPSARFADEHRHADKLALASKLFRVWRPGREESQGR